MLPGNIIPPLAMKGKITSLSDKTANMTVKYQPSKYLLCQAVVAWFVGASVFHSVNSAHMANGGSNPACGTMNMDEFILTLLSRYNSSPAIYGCLGLWVSEYTFTCFC